MFKLALTMGIRECLFTLPKLYKGLGSKSDSTIGCELLVQPGVVEAHISIHAILSGLKQN